MPFPTFVVAGTQKAATTWLYECLREHPSVFVSTPKELHFFCPKGECWKSRADLGMDWYLSRFPSGPFSAWGELSVDYMYYREVARTLAASNPDIRVLFVLRDPVDRAYSAYWMNRRNKPDMPPFRDYVRDDSQFVMRGYYWRQIQRYVEVLPRAQILVKIYETIRPDPQAFVADVYRFIGVDSSFQPPSLKQNIAATRAMPQALSRMFYRRISPILQLPAVMPFWRGVKHLTGINRTRLAARPNYGPLSQEDRLRLRALFWDDTQRLFDFLGGPVAQWGY